MSRSGLPSCLLYIFFVFCIFTVGRSISFSSCSTVLIGSCIQPVSRICVCILNAVHFVFTITEHLLRSYIKSVQNKNMEAPDFYSTSDKKSQSSISAAAIGFLSLQNAEESSNVCLSSENSMEGMLSTSMESLH